MEAVQKTGSHEVVGMDTDLKPRDGDLGGKRAEIFTLGHCPALQSQMERAHYMSVLVEKLAEVVTTLSAFKTTPQMTKI